MNTPLQHAAWAVIARWDSPAWKDMPHTGEYIDAMRKALEAEQAQAVEHVPEADFGNISGERAELIANMRGQCSNDEAHALLEIAADVLEAQQVAVPAAFVELPVAFGEIQYQRPSGQWGRIEGYTRNQMREAVAAAVAKTEAKQAQQVAVPDKRESNHLKDIYAFLASTAPPGVADEAFRNVPDSILPDSLRSEKLSLHTVKSDADGKCLGLAKQDSDLGRATDGTINSSQQVAVPDMFWNHDDADKLYGSISEFLNDEICNGTELAIGDIRTVQRAVRLPNIDIRITSVDEDECDADYEIVEAQGAKP